MSKHHSDTFATVTNDKEVVFSCKQNNKLNIGISSETPSETTPHIKFTKTDSNIIDIYGDVKIHNAIYDANGNIIGQSTTSDERIKSDITSISNNIDTVLKLKPVKYNKWNDMTKKGTFIIESGLVAQQIYNDASELRHIIKIADDSIVTLDGTVKHWGTTPATVNYNGIIPYLIGSIQELSNDLKIKNQIITTLEKRIECLEKYTNMTI